MDEPDGAGTAAMRGFPVVAMALAGFLFSLTPATDRLDNALLDLEWSMLRKFAARPAPDDIIVVGVDEASVRAVAEPLGLWHRPLGQALERIAAAHPRAIGLDAVLPERSYEDFHPGLDRPLLEGLAAARANGVLVAALTIDGRTRAARPIHSPFLAVLGESGLGIGLFGRDGDGVTRRFSLAIPTEDGAFPTLSGRLCRALSRNCTDGLIDFALGPPFKYVALRDVLSTRDTQYLEKLFHDRIVMIGDVQRFGDRIEVPVNLAGWEEAGRASPGVVVHAQTLRTALMGAPVEASRPLTVLIVTLAALIGLARQWRLAVASAVLAGALGLVGALIALHSGTFVPLSAALLTLVVACAWRTISDLSRSRAP